ncbi:MAG: prolyl aminopeptidase [Methylomonas sp.]|nr:prolyl aminopeptidase [Methylomonas sp.]PPD21049.1 MAG: prolyl aminopeptidase [Methylomonas sp.]PPD27075.1 MAG: prolyl aminopeptidase [Methylomonas sp.]PPD39007.1 MAG: prolyl aminopeptidase [Methylomonas sp.]PPD40872.1 MAG: prolyl aminopeptidase [Methylomonas sp.]
MKQLYPDITPFNTFFLETGSVHRVYVEQSGNPAGIPVIFLHGGPCSGTKPHHRCFFDPERYHIVLMDQRACGLSQPFGETLSNTTQDLIEDIERIRLALRVEQWLLFGGSWGATLALLYAQRYPKHVGAMILRGVFLARASDMDWFLGHGAHKIYPQAWSDLLDSVGANSADGLLARLCEAIFSADDTAVQNATRGWQAWGAQVALGTDYRGSDINEPLSVPLIQQTRMELNFARHSYFLAENQILAAIDSIQHIPTRIIHGQNDLTCPLEAAWRLHKAMPQSYYRVLPRSGHVAHGDEMVDALVSATDEMAQRLA